MNRSEIIEPHFAALLTPTKSRITFILSGNADLGLIFFTVIFGPKAVHTFSLN